MYVGHSLRIAATALVLASVALACPRAFASVGAVPSGTVTYAEAPGASPCNRNSSPSFAANAAATRIARPGDAASAASATSTVNSAILPSSCSMSYCDRHRVLEAQCCLT